MTGVIYFSDFQLVFLYTDSRITRKRIIIDESETYCN